MFLIPIFGYRFLLPIKTLTSTFPPMCTVQTAVTDLEGPPLLAWNAKNFFNNKLNICNLHLKGSLLGSFVPSHMKKVYAISSHNASWLPLHYGWIVLCNRHGVNCKNSLENLLAFNRMKIQLYLEYNFCLHSQWSKLCKFLERAEFGQ